MLTLELRMVVVVYYTVPHKDKMNIYYSFTKL